MNNLLNLAVAYAEETDPAIKPPLDPKALLREDPQVVREALDRILMAKRVDLGLDCLAARGGLEVLFPELQALVGFGGRNLGHKNLWHHVKQVVCQTPAEVHLRWAALFHDVAKPVCFSRETGKVSFHGHEVLSAKLWKQAAQRTKLFDQTFQERIWFLVRHLGYIENYEHNWTDNAVRRVYRDMGGYWDDLLALCRADMTTVNTARRKRNFARIQELEDRAAALVALDARAKPPKGLAITLSEALGIEKGPDLGRVMKAVQKAVAAGELAPTASADEYVQYARNL